jgi:transposase
MSVGIEALFTSALGLQEPWSVQDVKLDTSRRRIDFDLICKASRLPCPNCGASSQGVYDRLARE